MLVVASEPVAGPPYLNPLLPYVQQRYRNEAHSHTLEGDALEAYEAQFDDERKRLRDAVRAWAPAAPVRKEYGALRQDICLYNAAMRNGYARTCVEFENQELRGRQEAFKARVRHDLLDHYDVLARACKNLWVPDVYETLQRKARKAMAATYPELFDLAAFENWRCQAPEAESDDAELALAPQQEPCADCFDPQWLDTPVVKVTELRPFTDDEVSAALRCQARPSDARKLFFAVLKKLQLPVPAPTLVRTRVAELRVQLQGMAARGLVRSGAGLLSAWDEPVEPTWRICDAADTPQALNRPESPAASAALPELGEAHQ